LRAGLSVLQARPGLRGCGAVLHGDRGPHVCPVAGLPTASALLGVSARGPALRSLILAPLGLVAIVEVFPYLWMVNTSLQDMGALTPFPPSPFPLPPPSPHHPQPS